MNRPWLNILVFFPLSVLVVLVASVAPLGYDEQPQTTYSPGINPFYFEPGLYDRMLEENSKEIERLARAYRCSICSFCSPEN